MYRILMVVFVSLCALVMYSMEKDGKKTGGYTLLWEQVLPSAPAVDPGLSIEVRDGSEHSDLLVLSPPLTSPPKTIPLTPTAPTGESPALGSGSPATSEECEAFVSPLSQNSAVHKRVQSFCDLDIRKRQPLTRGKWCCIVGSCAGVGVLAGAVLYVVYKYTHAF
ncbi:MAG: hypothetical protein ACHQVS_05500 [Candidatus Babeliales bacterium]